MWLHCFSMRSLFVVLYIPISLAQYLGGYGMGYPYNDMMQYQQQMMGMYGNGMSGYGMYNPYLMSGYGMQYDPTSSGYGLLGMGNNMGMGMGNQMGGLGTNMLNNGNTMRRRISSTGSTSNNYGNVHQGCSGGCGNSGWLDRAKNKKS